MAVDIKDIKKYQLKQMQNNFAKQLEKVMDFEEENDFNIPFKEKKDFEKFDTKLSNDLKFRESFVSIFEKDFFQI